MKKHVSTINPARLGVLLLAALLSVALAAGGFAPSLAASSGKVTASAASKAKISKSKATLAIGATLVLKVSGANAKIKWSSSNKKVATVSSKGKVKAVKAGKATIKATYKKSGKTKTLKCAVTVNAKPAPKLAPAAKAGFVKAAVKLPSKDMDYTVNYIIATLPAGSSGYSFAINGKAAAATPVLADGSLVKIAVPAGTKTVAVAAKKGGVDAGSASLAFASAGLAAPKIIYGTVPMKFSEYFHDVTADDPLPTGTVFPKSGAVAKPKLFITQGTRTGNVVGGVDTLTYTEAEAGGLPYVDTISTATYGDSVHFVPDANLSLRGNRQVNTDPNKAITGIAAAEAGVSFDLYANAAILKNLGKATSYSRNVMAKLAGTFNLLNVVKADGSVTDAAGRAVSAPEVYKPKLMLTDGNWGARTLVNAAAVKELPGVGNAAEAEDVAYGGRWGEKVTGFSFGNAAALGAEYSGANYWDNFANYIYGGVITDSDGHSEPLVFLQNLFTHRMHTDFDVALSPSYFSRLNELKSPDTYTVTVFVDGFKDVTFRYSVKNYVNASAFAEGFTATTGAIDQYTYVKGLNSSASFAAEAKLMKGATEIPASQYTLVATGKSSAKLTLKAALFAGSYQGAYTLVCEESALRVSKPIGFSIVNPLAVKLALSDGGTATQTGYSEAAPLVVSKAGQPSVWLTGGTGAADFAKTLVTSGRSGFSTIQTVAPTQGQAAAIGAALARADLASPYRIDISSGAFEAGNTYKLTLIAPGFNTQTFYIQVTA